MAATMRIAAPILSSFHAPSPPPPQCAAATTHFSFNSNIRAPNSLFSTTLTTNKPSSILSIQPLSPPPRKLLSRPPAGKYLHDDYLVKKLSAAEVQELVKREKNVPIVLDFYATWCGPCVLMAQELEMLAVEYQNNALIVKVDTDDEYEFARDMQVRGLPTLYFISPNPNKEAIRTEGLIPLEMMRDIIDNEM